VHEKQLTREVGKKFALKTCPKRSPSRTPGKKKPLQRALLNEYQVFKQLEQVCQTELTPFIVKCFAMYQDENYVFTIMVDFNPVVVCLLLSLFEQKVCIQSTPHFVFAALLGIRRRW
jgi:hypothetical protein